MTQKYFYALLLAFTFFSGFGQTLDQSNTSYNQGQLILAPNYPYLAQSFTNGLTGMLSRISVDIQDNPVYPTIGGDFDLTIYSGEGISGTVLLTHTFSVADNFIGELVINFNSVSVTSGTVNTFKISPSASSPGRLLVSMKSGNNYSGGILYNGNYGPSTDIDLWFKTFVTVPTPATHLNFDGANDYVNLGTSLATSLNGSTSLTFEAWINPSVLNGWNNIITDYNGAYHKVLLRIRNSNNIQFVVNSTFLNSSYAIPLNTWTHVAAVYDGANMYVYANGSLVASQPAVVSLPTSTDQFNIGSRVGGSEYFTGNIDDVRVWNIARTAEQIAGAMNCELQGNESGLLAYYQFNQGIDQADNSTVTTLTDATTNANNGTLTNFVLTGSTSNWLAGSPVTTGSVVPSAPTVSTPVVYYLGDTASELTATQGANATGLLWYTSATGETGSTTAPTPSTSTLGSASYWVSSTNANGCESERVQIIVNVYLSNDECSDAINLTVGSSSFNDFPEDVLLTGATGSSSISNPSCGNYQGGDVWYTVTVPASGNLVIETDGVGIYDSGIEVYTGVCETLSLVACDDNSGNGNYSKVLLLGQTPGTVFYIRVWENFWGASNAQFQISAYDYVVPATHLNFDGVNDFVEVPKPFTSDFTIEYWVKTLSTGTTGAQWYNGHSIVDNEIGGVTSDFGTSLMGSKLAFGIGGPDTTILSTSDINNGTWNHVAVTWKQSTGQMQLYINGVLESTGTSSTAARTAANFIKIGTSNNFGSYFNGDVDELRIWNVVLSEEDIVATKDCELQPNQTNLLAYYKFNQGFDLINNASVTTLIDEINSNNGTLNNFTLNGATSNWKSGSIVTTGNTCPLVLGASSFSENKFAMYPNPTKGIFSVNTEEALTIEIYDIVGKLVKKQKIEIGTSSFDITALNSGMYLVKTINSENISEVFKLIKE
jgi:hypothetical protein